MRGEQRPLSKLDKNAFGLATTFYENVALSFVIPSEAEGSAVPRTLPGKVEYYAQTELSCRSELFTTEAASGGPATVFPWTEDKKCRSCTRASWLKSLEPHRQDKHPRGPSTPRHKAPCYAIDLRSASLRMTLYTLCFRSLSFESRAPYRMSSCPTEPYRSIYKTHPCRSCPSGADGRASRRSRPVGQ
jgi:hypothetical protein